MTIENIVKVREPKLLDPGIDLKAEILLSAYHYPETFEHNGEVINNPQVSENSGESVLTSLPLGFGNSYRIEEEGGIKAFHALISNSDVFDELQSTLALLNWDPDSGKHCLNGEIEQDYMHCFMSDLREYVGFRDLYNKITEWQKSGMQILSIDYMVKPGF